MSTEWSIRSGGTRPSLPLVISSFDRLRLLRLINAQQTDLYRDDLSNLARRIESALEVMPHEMPPDVITMNSMFRITNLDSGTSYVYTIVYPSDADYRWGRISVLAPLGTALLGYRVGEVVAWDTVIGECQMRIDKMIYQPESAGDFNR